MFGGKKIIKKYSNGEITVVWQPHLCIHSTICFRKLPSVFRPRERPWVKIDAESTDKIIETVNACPSDALTWYYNNQEKQKGVKTMENNTQEKPEITIFENGPIYIPAGINVKDHTGKLLKVNEDKYICRCGHSKNKPFCDGSHVIDG